jgi:hypothetical protein
VLLRVAFEDLFRHQQVQKLLCPRLRKIRENRQSSSKVLVVRHMNSTGRQSRPRKQRGDANCKLQIAKTIIAVRILRIKRFDVVMNQAPNLLVHVWIEWEGVFNVISPVAI